MALIFIIIWSQLMHFCMIYFVILNTYKWMPFSRISVKGSYPYPGDGQLCCARLVQGTVVSNSVCQVIFWILSMWQPPWQGRCLAGLSTLWPGERLSYSHAFLRSFGPMTSCLIIHLYSSLKHPNHPYPRKLSHAEHSHQNIITDYLVLS